MKSLIAALIVSIAIAPSFSQNGPPAGVGNPSVTGDVYRSNGNHQTYSVRVYPDGTVKGSGVANFESGPQEGRYVTTVYDQLLFSADGKSAYLGGYRTSDNWFPETVGWRVLQKVTDNGRGNSSALDATTLGFSDPSLSFVLPFFVGYLDLQPMSPILSGNITVKPG